MLTAPIFHPLGQVPSPPPLALVSFLHLQKKALGCARDLNFGRGNIFTKVIHTHWGKKSSREFVRKKAIIPIMA